MPGVSIGADSKPRWLTHVGLPVKYPHIDPKLFGNELLGKSRLRVC